MAAVAEIWTYRGLIGNLAQRELKAKYKKSVLGWTWSLLNPAATLGIYSLVFGVFLKVKPPLMGNGDTRIFALYLFAALVVWNFFNAVMTGSMAALTGAGPLIKKVYFPPECAVIGNLLATLLQACVEASILAFIMVILGNVSFTFLLFPYLLVLLVIFSLGIGLVVSLWNAYFRDVNYLVGLALNLFFYATPIIYPLNIVPKDAGGIPMRDIVSLSPLTQFTQMSRDIFYGLEWPSLDRVAYLTAWSLVVLGIGWAIFTRYSADVTEEL